MKRHEFIKLGGIVVPGMYLAPAPSMSLADDVDVITDPTVRYSF